MNVIARLEYELAYYDSAVYRFNHYTTRCVCVCMCACVCVCVCVWLDNSLSFKHVWLNNNYTFCLYNLIRILSSFLIHSYTLISKLEKILIKLYRQNVSLLLLWRGSFHLTSGSPAFIKGDSRVAVGICWISSSGVTLLRRGTVNIVYSLDCTVQANKGSNCIPLRISSFTIL